LPPKLTESVEQLVKNALKFGEYQTSERNSTQRNFWNREMRKDHRLLHVITEDQHIFCPSIFAGYEYNGVGVYKREELSSELTDARIGVLLRKEAQTNANSADCLREALSKNDISFQAGISRREFWVLKKNERGEIVSIPSNLEQFPNCIFYGPPGTGKTYHTVNAALAILDPDFDESKNRSELMDRFEELKSEGRIEFATFHQSFSYEEFVEGLKATTGDSGQIIYEVQDGIFKILCERSRAGKVYLSIDQALNQLKEDCSEEPIPMQTLRGRDIVVSYPGKTTFRVDPVEGKTSENPVNINSIRKVMLGEDSKGIYHLSYIRAIIRYIEENYKISGIVSSNEQQPRQEPHVLIIDEINRGNISRIFGELITLIEPSKRAGEEDALSVTLPYSGESFSVPKNLYIIGTMNTADRSIALLDTALRRRFRFVEMMPDLTLLDGVTVEGVEIRRLLSAMNERIEALYDRDHQIGHAYFLPLKKLPILARLSDIFRHSVLPLLQEYFYEDWEKIDMVLGKNGFLKSTSPPSSLNLEEEKKLWRIDEDAFSNAENYRKIYEG